MELLKRIIISLLLAAIFVGCKKPENNGTPPDVPENPVTPVYNHVAISTDKAAFSPGDEVIFKIDNSVLSPSAKVRYKYLGEVISEHAVISSVWKWITPEHDFRGYMAEVYALENNVETIYATIAVDVSSDWTRFPRYGFLTDYSQFSDEELNKVIDNLNRHHINGLQFYDWHNKHHMPLPVSGSIPASKWKDIINRDVYFSTVEGYITCAHNRNMKAMFYNLIYGAWKDAELDGVQKEWYVYNDNTHTNRDFHSLPTPPFLSNIYLLDPSNTDWQKYLINQDRIVYEHLNFDGFHMDQLGNRGNRYTYDGSFLNLSQTYQSFIEADKADQPEKYSVMNAVNQYGQEGIAAAPTNFLYTEVWDPFDTYADLANLIKQNNVLGNQSKNSVLAAYVNYDLADEKGYFNTASVLMTNAVIFAFGGAHLELGEHMLAKEYFPNDNLAMKTDLQIALVSYYDFLVAYQNLLRDGGSFNTVDAKSLDHKMTLATWPAVKGFVAIVGKQLENKQVIHFINFTDSSTDMWRDNEGIQVIPAMIKDAKVELTSTETIKNITVASPDIIGGASRSIHFIQVENKIYFTLPELKYWSMVVMESE
jgi:dextranase